MVLVVVINRYLLSYNVYVYLMSLFRVLSFVLIRLDLCGFLCMCEQPMIYGRGPMPAGMQMVPMVLPDGRIGYVL